MHDGRLNRSQASAEPGHPAAPMDTSLMTKAPGEPTPAQEYLPLNSGRNRGAKQAGPGTVIEAAVAPDMDDDRLREECGVFGIFGHPDAAAITALGLHALQHRGQEAAGIVTFDGTRFHSERRLGLVGDTFSRREVIERLPGNAAVGHVRYSTTGATILRNVQPLFAELNAGGFAVGHNGNLPHGLTLRREPVLH